MLKLYSKPTSAPSTLPSSQRLHCFTSQILPSLRSCNMEKGKVDIQPYTCSQVLDWSQGLGHQAPLLSNASAHNVSFPATWAKVCSLHRLQALKGPGTLQSKLAFRPRRDLGVHSTFLKLPMRKANQMEWFAHCYQQPSSDLSLDPLCKRLLHTPHPTTSLQHTNLAKL